MRRLRFLIVPLALLAMAIGATIAIRKRLHGHHAHETSVSAEALVLQRQREGLKRLLAAAEKGRLLAFDHVLVSVDQVLFQRLLESRLPFERVVAGRWKIRVTAARVQFEDGFALVRLEGRASLAQATEEQAFADVSFYGGLDVVEIDPLSGVLRGSVRVLALDARRVDVMGMSAPEAEHLVEDLGREQLEAFSALASRIEVPVQIQREVTLPAVGPEGGVRIAAASWPVTATVAQVEAFHGRLWVWVSVDTRGKS